MKPSYGCLSSILSLLAVAFCLIASTSCSSGEFTEPRTLTAREIAGNYRSTDPAGVLGVLQLSLVRSENTRVYSALLSGENAELFGTAEGIGTLADDHLVLNFDRGLKTDFYFEGKVQLESGLVRALAGEFIFPDQTEQLAVEFTLLDN